MWLSERREPAPQGACVYLRSPFADSIRDPVAGSGNFILITVAIFPVLFALDVPSVMLLSRLRLPRWVFALLVLRALANAARR
jgi:hypothetical protein